MDPKVSICVPNLNTRPFLPERFQTIREQSLNDWELLVYDSHSTDGAWEYICELAGRSPGCAPGKGHGKAPLVVGVRASRRPGGSTSTSPPATTRCPRTVSRSSWLPSTRTRAAMW